MSNFANKVVLITGGYQGIGNAIAKKFLELGAKVAIYDKEKTVIDGVLSVNGDIRDEKATESFLKEIEQKLGAVNVLVNNVGLGLVKHFFQTTPDDFDTVSDVNFKSPFFITQKVAAKMKDGDSIIFITSIHATNPSLDPTYDASKAAINNLVLNLALELAPRGIRVNAVAPGHIDTKNQNPRNQADVPLGRKAGSPDNIADAVVFLSDPNKASYITGAILPITAGLHIPKT